MDARSWAKRNVAAITLLVAVGTAAAQAPVKPVAVVNGSTITMAEVETILKREGPTATPLTESQRRQRQAEALNMLIDDLLMRQYLSKHAPHIDPAGVNKRFNDLADALKKEGKNLADFCKDNGQDEAMLRTDIAAMMQWEGYLKEHVSENDMHRYYEANKDFFDRVTVRASHIVLRLSPEASPGERQASSARLQALRQEIVSGKIDFAEAAKKYSQDSTAPAGGDIGFFPRKFAVDDAFAKAAFALNVGQVSDVVETAYGVHLIKVTERKPGQPSEYSKIKDDVQMFFIEELRLALLDEQRKAAHIEVNLPQ
jgi:peptidyl-prolyl cis-trans isomerase C